MKIRTQEQEELHLCIFTEVVFKNQGSPGSSAGQESARNAGDPSSIPGSGSSSGEGIGYPLQYSWASLVAQTVKNPPATRETWAGEIPWRRAWPPTPVFLPGEFHGQRSLAGDSPWGRKESDTTEWLSTAWYLKKENFKQYNFKKSVF